MVSPLGCLVQFTHSRKSLAESVNLTRLWFRSLGSWPKLPKPPEVRMDAPPNRSCESVGNVLEERVLENHESKQLLNGWPKPGHYRAVFSIDRPPLLAVGLRRSRKRVLGFRRKILVALEHENHKELPADVSFDPTITPHSCALSRNDIGVFQWRFQ